MINLVTDGQGTKRWFNKNRKLHREDGPAVIYSDGYKSWWINDIRYRDNQSFKKAANITDEDMTAIILKYGNVT
jgi:hypothetical protein